MNKKAKYSLVFLVTILLLVVAITILAVFPESSIAKAIMNSISPVATIGFVAWIVKSLASQALTKDIEKLKSDLTIMAKSHSIRYEKIYNKRADIISTLYGKIVKSQWMLNQLKPLGKGEYTLADAKNTLDELRMYYLSSQIYFTKETVKTINNLISKMSDFIKKVGDNETRNKKEFSKEELDNILYDDFYTAMELIEVDFRQYIDIESKVVSL